MENIKINDDAYWVNWLRDCQNGTIKEIENGAEKLGKLVAFLWTSYTVLYGVGGIFVFDFTKYDAISLIAVCLLALPIVALMLSVWFCYRAQLPVIESIVRNPGIDDIKEAHDNIVSRKHKRLNVALISAFISAIFMASGLIALFIQHNSVQI
jgi:hypothetical protein